jgi:hypothetical protein
MIDSSSIREEEIHHLLALNPHVLLDCFTHPSPLLRKSLTKFRLGNEFTTDFALVAGHSMRYECILIELESPSDRLFTKSGIPAKKLVSAIKQISDWNTWISKNGSFFRSELARRLVETARLDLSGEKQRTTFAGAHQIELLDRGFVALNPIKLEFKIVIGRRRFLSREDNERRASLCQMAESLEIVTYDRLLDFALEPE